MQDSIYTIPISEVFEPKEGCPICRLRKMLEDRCVDYIMGAAMMEPDIRQETNRLGFCKDHFAQMLGRQKRLPLALILESHLAQVEKNVLGGLTFGSKGKSKKASKLEQSCYVCHKIDGALDKMLDTTLTVYAREADFRKLYAGQECLCLPHYTVLCQLAAEKLGKKESPEFIKVSTKLAKDYLAELRGDVSHFCKMFDYRNSGENADWGNSRDAVERAIWFLTGWDPEAK